VEDCTLPFAEVRTLSPVAFLQHLAGLLPVGGFVCGPDFRFGHRRAGDAELLAGLCRERGWSMQVVEPCAVGGRVVSSSAVREALEAGDLASVAAMLGRTYRLHGRVVPGDGRGRQIDVPTANLAELANAVPAEGVYAGRAHLAPHLPNHPLEPAAGPDTGPGPVSAAPWGSSRSFCSSPHRSTASPCRFPRIPCRCSP